MINKEIARYINRLLTDREKLLDKGDDELWVDGKIKSESSLIYQAQKAMDYFIEEDV